MAFHSSQSIYKKYHYYKTPNTNEYAPFHFHIYIPATLSDQSNGTAIKQLKTTKSLAHTHTKKEIILQS